MRLADFIRAEKTDIKLGDWHAGKIPRANFPMSGARGKAYKFGPSYSWQLITFVCLGRHCRVLILMNEGKAMFRASFGVDCGNDTVLLCDHEFHGDHPGWHCHLATGDFDDLAPGINRADKRRWPRKGAQHSQKEFGITKENARHRVLERFRISQKGSLL